MYFQFATRKIWLFLRCYLLFNVIISIKYLVYFKVYSKLKRALIWDFILKNNVKYEN